MTPAAAAAAAQAEARQQMMRREIINFVVFVNVSGRRVDKGIVGRRKDLLGMEALTHLKNLAHVPFSYWLMTYYSAGVDLKIKPLCPNLNHSAPEVGTKQIEREPIMVPRHLTRQLIWGT